MSVEENFECAQKLLGCVVSECECFGRVCSVEYDSAVSRGCAGCARSVEMLVVMKSRNKR